MVTSIPEVCEREVANRVSSPYLLLTLRNHTEPSEILIPATSPSRCRRLRRSDQVKSVARGNGKEKILLKSLTVAGLVIFKSKWVGLLPDFFVRGLINYI